MSQSRGQTNDASGPSSGSDPPIGQSQTISPGGASEPAISSAADAAVGTATAVVPQDSKSPDRRRSLSGCSPTKITGASASCAGNGRITSYSPGTGVGSVSRVKMNAEPSPTTLSTRMPPPIRTQSRSQIASPSPVPPKRRVVEESTWLKALKSRLIRSAGIPMPLSRTENSSWSRPSVRCEAIRTSIAMLPAAVNFTALLTRLEITCQTRVTSPVIQVGTPGPRL